MRFASQYNLKYGVGSLETLQRRSADAASADANVDTATYTSATATSADAYANANARTIDRAVVDGWA